MTETNDLFVIVYLKKKFPNYLSADFVELKPYSTRDHLLKGLC